MSSTLIIGAGPTGLAAALFLSELGVSPRVVDEAIEPLPYSKAFGVNPRTLSLLEGTGVTERLLAQGRRMTALNVWRRGRNHFRLDLALVDHRYPFMLIHSQAGTEAVLADALAARGIAVERGVAFARIEATPAELRVTLRHWNGREEEAAATVLLGADGAGSSVRKALGVGFPGSAFEEPWRLYDLVLDTPLAPDEAHAFLLNGGAAFAVRLRDDLWRLLGNVPDLPERLPETTAGRVEWESDFGISHRMAERFQVGAACLAGDAAHIHSGLGARGMNLGIEDAYVFATLVSEGRIEEYESLRQPVVAKVMRQVERLTAVPRGRSFIARMVRLLLPVLSPIMPAVSGPARTFILGLDHDVALSRTNPKGAEPPRLAA